MNPYNSNSLTQQIFGGAQNKQIPNISEQQFFSVTSTLDKTSLQKLVSQARLQGISDQDIQSGLDILLQHRS